MALLEKIRKTGSMSGLRAIVTGCGYRPVRYVFRDGSGNPIHDAISVGGQEMKLNIGAATAAVLAVNGADVHMVSSSEDKLSRLEKELSSASESCITYSALDLLDEGQVHDFVANLPRDKPLCWVQSVGLGAGSYRLQDDNPYLPLERIPLELIEKESQILLRATHLMMCELLPVLRAQEESRIAIISSMSAVRGYSYGGTHCAAKGAIDRYANAAMLALYKAGIYVTTIRPGGVDTGMYDSPSVQEAVRDVSDEYGGSYRSHFALAPPSSVGEAVLFAFTASAHIPSLNLVAKGQFPHEGS